MTTPKKMVTACAFVLGAVGAMATPAMAAVPTHDHAQSAPSASAPASTEDNHSSGVGTAAPSTAR